MRESTKEILYQEYKDARNSQPDIPITLWKEMFGDMFMYLESRYQREQDQSLIKGYHEIVILKKIRNAHT